MGLLIFTLKEIKLLRLHNSDMKRLLLPLLAALALPTAANAETWWLVVGARFARVKPATTSWQIPTNSLDECERAGEKLLANSQLNGKVFSKDLIAYECLKGK